MPAEGFELKKIEIGGLNRVRLHQKAFDALPFAAHDGGVPGLRQRRGGGLQHGRVCRGAAGDGGAGRRESRWW